LLKIGKKLKLERADFQMTSNIRSVEN
jgi:hypothetical protein